MNNNNKWESRMEMGNTAWFISNWAWKSIIQKHDQSIPLKLKTVCVGEGGGGWWKHDDKSEEES